MSASGAGSSRLTLTDVGIVLVTIALSFGGLLLPTMMRLGNGDGSGRVKCASNLRQVGQAIQLYANVNKGKLPRTVYDGQGGAPTFYTGVDAADPFGPGGPGPNDVTAALFLLVRSVDIGTEPFTCPQAAVGKPWDLGGKRKDRVSNFPGRQFIGYGFNNPYPTAAAVAAGLKLDYTLTSDFALAADISPGPPTVVSVKPNSPRREMSRANSPNHKGDGQNVLYADGHVEFQNTPFCGMLRHVPPAKPFRDNIYTYGAGFGGAAGVGVVGAGVDPLDSVVLPYAPEGPAPFTGGGATPATLLLRGIVAAAVVGAVVGALVIAVPRLRRKRAAAPPSSP